jgi:hypothetical protein
MSSIAIFARQSLAQFCVIYAEITDGLFIPAQELESLMWSKICAKEAGMEKLPFKTPIDNIKKTKLQLPYLPDDIKYTGCPAIKKNGGLYTPCCGKVKADETVCVACGKADIKFGTTETRSENIENELFAPISYGEWMKAHKMDLSEVYSTLSEGGISIEIPQIELQVRDLPKKTRRGRPGKSDDSVIEDEDSPKKGKKPKKTEESDSEEPKSKKSKSKISTESDSEVETPKSKKSKKEKKTKSEDSDAESESETKPKKEKKEKKAKKAKSEDSEAESESKAEIEAPKKSKKSKSEDSDAESESKSRKSESDSEGSKKKAKKVKPVEPNVEAVVVEVKEKKDKKEKKEKKSENSESEKKEKKDKKDKKKSREAEAKSESSMFEEGEIDEIELNFEVAEDEDEEIIVDDRTLTRRGKMLLDENGTIVGKIDDEGEIVIN